MTIFAARLVLCAGLLTGVGATTQNVPPPSDDPNAIVVTGGRDLPHCRQRSGDPLDAVNVSPPEPGNHVVMPDGHGSYSLVRDFVPVTGPDVWQRSGQGMDSYVYRVPTDGTPMCMGSLGHGAPNSFSQLRRIMNAGDLRGKYVRFTAFVATRREDSTRAWLAGVVACRYEMPVGDQESKEMRGTGNWAPMSITIGPITSTTAKISYGFLLQGKGDLWITQPKLEVFDMRPADTRGLKRPI